MSIKARYVSLPSMHPAGTIEACAAPLAYLTWLAWPHDDQGKHRNNCFKGAMASVAKAARLPRPEFPDSAKDRKPKRADAKLNDAFRIIMRRRWRAATMAQWRVSEGLSQISASKRLVDWSHSESAEQAKTCERRKGLWDDEPILPDVRKRIWRESRPVIPMAWGFFHATGFMQGNPLPKSEIIAAPDWLPVAIELCEQMAKELAELEPSAQFTIPCLR